MQTETSTNSQTNFNNISQSIQICIQNCLECYQICTRTIEHCLSKGGQHAELKHIKLLQDCAYICNLSADFMLRGSDFHSTTCKACAEICKACTESCEAMAVSDAEMQACAQACRKCATTCQDMSKMQ